MEEKGYVRALAREGPAALSPVAARALGTPPPLPEAQDKAMAATIRQSHCDLLPEAMVPGMLRVQQARNALLARRVVEGVGQAGSAVLITGNGHARSDRGVPWVLGRLAPRLDAVAVGILEVRPGLEAPADYALDAAAGLPYQYVHFTAALPAGDPCAVLRERFGGAHGAHGARSGDGDRDD